MPRSRNIKPGLYENDKLAECSIPARYIFPGLWMLADKEGRLEDRPKRIKAQLLPYDNLEITGLLQELHERSFIARYTVNGENYIQVVNFSKHQNPHKNEKESVIPPMPENIGNLTVQEISRNYSNIPVMQQTNPADSLFLIPDSLIPDSLIPEEQPTTPKRKIKKGKEVKPSITLDDLSIEHIADWLVQKRSQGMYRNFDEHKVLEGFKDYCLANGAQYKDYVAAFRNAFGWERFAKEPFQKKKELPTLEEHKFRNDGNPENRKKLYDSYKGQEKFGIFLDNNKKEFIRKYEEENVNGTHFRSI